MLDDILLSIPSLPWSWYAHMHAHPGGFTQSQYGFQMRRRIFWRGTGGLHYCAGVSLRDLVGRWIPPVIAQLVERQTVEAAVICWSLVRFRVTGLLLPRVFACHFSHSMKLLQTFSFLFSIASCVGKAALTNLPHLPRWSGPLARSCSQTLPAFSGCEKHSIVQT